MVVKDFVTLDSGKNISFNLAESENITKKYLQDFEKERDFKFEIMRDKIDRSQLKVVFFIQEKETKKVLNAVICDVKN